MDESAIYSGLTEIFREVFADDTLCLRPDMTAHDIAGWDSTRMITIILAVQEKFGVKVRSREVDRLTCVGDLAKLVSARG